MISKENILKLGTRRKIYNFILEYPGLHLRELSRRTNIPLGVLRHHLNFLKKQGLVIKKTDRRYVRYYVTQKVGKKDKEIINLLRQEVPRRIILLLLSPGPGNIYQNKDTQKKALKNPATFLKTYSKRELVELTRYWNGPYGGLFHLRKHRTTTDFHLEKLLDVDLIEKVKVGKEIKYKLKDEDMIWVFLIRYKNALSNASIDRYLIWRDDTVEEMTDLIIEAVFDIFPHPYRA